MSSLDYLRIALLAIAGIVVCWIYLCVWTVEEANKASRRERAKKLNRYGYPGASRGGKDWRR